MKIKRLLIILGCCVITLFSLVFVGCKREKANASIYSQNVLIELPSFAISIGDNNGYVPTMYLGYDTDFYLYYLRSGNGLQPYYFKAYFNTTQYLHYVYSAINNDNFMYNIFADLALNTNGNSLSISTNYLYTDIISLTTRINIDSIGGNLYYNLLDNNDNSIAFIDIGNIKTFNHSVMNYNYALNLISTTILLDEEALLNNAYNVGYTDGYNYGYDSGYRLGYNSGVTDGFGATTPFDVFVDSIERFLNIELFGFFKISSLFYITFGLIMLGIVIKVFLGG